MKLDQFASVALTVAALSVAVVVVRREFFPASAVPNSVGPKVGPPTYIPDWKRFRKSGVLLGDSTAGVTIVEFADLECPYCKKFHRSLEAAKKEFGSDLSLIFVHWPIESHRFARPAARAAECARDQKKFAEFIDAAYDKQDSLGLKSWSSFAVEAGVDDTLTFNNCLKSSAAIPIVEAGLELGNEIGVTATPTVVINGWRYGRVPYDSLAKAIRESLMRKPPRS